MRAGPDRVAVVTGALCLAFLAGAGCDDDGPVKPMLPPEYFPLAVGHRWTYASVDTLGVPGTDTLVVAVVADTVVGGNPAFRVRSEERRLGPGGPGGPPVPQVFVSQRVVVREAGWLVYYTIEGDSTWQRYRRPLITGDHWAFVDSAAGWSITYDVLAPIDVVVPAGHFSSCLPVRNIERESGTDTDIEYFAEDVGLVRRLGAEGGGWALAAYRVTP